LAWVTHFVPLARALTAVWNLTLVVYFVTSQAAATRWHDKPAGTAAAQADAEREAEAASLETFLRGGVGKAEDAVETGVAPGAADAAVEEGQSTKLHPVPEEDGVLFSRESGMAQLQEPGRGRSVYFDEEENVGQTRREASRLEWQKCTRARIFWICSQC
jgi:hypothetical protein